MHHVLEPHDNKKNTRTQRSHIILTTRKANDASAADDDAAANVEHAADEDGNENVVHAADIAVPLIANTSRQQLHPQKLLHANPK